MKLFCILISLLILLTLAACRQTQPSEPSASTEQSLASSDEQTSIEGKETESETADSSAVPENDDGGISSVESAADAQSDEPMSYEEYFSCERYVETQSDRFLINSRFIYYIGDEGGIDVGDTYITVHENEPPYHLYCYDKEHDSYRLLFDGQAQQFYVTTTCIYVLTKDSCVYEIGADRQSVTLIYEHPKPIELWYPFYKDLHFFISNASVFRVYLPTGQVDELYHNDKLTIITPLTNFTFLYDPATEEKIPDTVDIKWIYSAFTGLDEFVSDELRDYNSTLIREIYPLDEDGMPTRIP